MIQYLNLPVFGKIIMFLGNRGATNGCILSNFSGDSSSSMLKLDVWESIFYLFGVGWPACENIPLPLFPLTRNSKAFWKGYCFLESLFPDYIPCSFELPNNSHNLFFDVKNLATLFFFYKQLQK